MIDAWTIEAINRTCHELRRPLTVIQSFGELLADEVSGALNADQHEHVQAVLRGARSLERQVRGLFDLTEIESCRMQLAPERCDLATLVAELHPDYAARFERAGIGLDLELGFEPVSVTADAARVRRALACLLDNALHFVPSGAEVVVRLESTPDGARIEVADTGPGVPTEDLVRIFEPFARSRERGGTADDGIGLGLALCRAYVEAHGGHVGARPTSPGGLTIRIDSPTAPTGAIESPLENSVAGAAVQGTGSGENAT